MGLLRIKCPECGAGLKSSSGFKTGETVECPKCETNFSVPEPEDEDRPSKSNKPMKAAASRDPDDDDDDDRPKKKKKKKRRDDDDEGSYKTSPLRFAILGVLVVVMLVLGFMLYRKNQREKEDAAKPADDEKPLAGPQVGGPRGPGPRPLAPPPLTKGGPGIPSIATPKQPGDGLNPQPGFNPADPLAGLFGNTPFEGSAESKQLIEKLSGQLVGTWEGAIKDGETYKITYQANGQFTSEVTGGDKPGTTSGMWKAVGLIGRKGLKLSLGAGPPVKVVFEDDELVHDTATPGATVVLRKK